ncbi:MAG: HEPN domain-containing protein [Nanoarchaeota archaeon]|nr:HEPN domain-containing protein [Nanoarchaeota archaeon]
MSHAKNKVDWCLKKAEKEVKEQGSHRGLVKSKPDKEKAFKFIGKAEHNFKAAVEFSKIGFSDWSASAFFYSMYHCFLAISAKFGYESGNQECTFALIKSLAEDKKIDLDREIIEKVASIDINKSEENTTGVKIREQYQYGTQLSIDEDLYKELFELAQILLSKTKEIIEE